MMLMSGDSHVMRDIALMYCSVSLITYSIATITLYFTDFYLLAGKRDILNLHMVFMLLDVIKWLYHKMNLEKDYRISYKKKSLSFFPLFTKTFDIIHLFKSLCITILGSFAFHFVAILFGAEVFDKYEETYLFSLHMSILTVFPMCLNFGPTSITHLASGLKPHNMLHNLLYRSFQMTVFGAWSGAFVIPLDWDRPWQVWPIPCSFGALVACTVSYLVMYLQMYFMPFSISSSVKKK